MNEPSAEARLLLACASVGPGADDPGHIASLARPELDWRWFLEAATGHGVLPLVHRRLAAAGVVRAELREATMAVARENLRLTNALLAIVGEFERRGIRVLAWKGPTLALLVWGDLALRLFRDLDLVVHPEDLPAATVALGVCGYRPEIVYTGALAAAVQRRDCETVFVRDGTNDRVELHWGFARAWAVPALTVTGAWTRRQMMRLGGGVVVCPGLEDLLIGLTQHGAMHVWERVGWIVDVGRLATDPRIDWEALLTRAREVGAERMLLLGLSLAQQLLGMSMPPAAADRCASHSSLRRLVDRVTGELFNGLPGHLGGGAQRAFELLVCERARDRARMAAGMAFAVGPADWAAVPLPGWLHPVRYLLRPLRLAWRFGLRLAAAWGFRLRLSQTTVNGRCTRSSVRLGRR